MKVRKLAVALALAGGLGSGVAQALGLGEIELQSFLNEPLDAEINLRKSEGVSPGDVFVNIAPQSAFERVGIERSYFLTKLNFQVTTAPNGSLVVNVSTSEPLREPYLNFLVEVTWPNGRLMREYAVLVDPPVYSEESGVTEQVSVPATGQASQPQQAQRSASAGTTPRTTTSTRQYQSTGARTLGPTNSADTLWTIAAQTRPNNNVSMQQMMLAIQDLNPDAFIDGNINRLKRGEILRIPDENQIRSRSRAQANQEVAVQNRAFSSPQRTVDATDDTADAPAGEAAGSGGGDQLRLMAADDASSRDAEEGGSAGGDGDTAGGVDAGSAVAMEQLESARRENDELTGRVDDLQDQVQTLQRLLELKNSQLAEMQNTQQESANDLEMMAEDPSETAAESDEATDSELAPDASESDDMASVDGEAEMTAGETERTDAGQSPGETDEAVAPAAEDASAEQAAEEESEPAETAEPEAEAAPQPQPEAAPEPVQKPFPANIIEAITSNFLYQVALGGGLIVLLLLLLLLARRNANREKAFYDQLNSETEGDEPDSFDLTFDEDESTEAPEDDAIAEADAYIAYGRHDQAAHTLETAISREPSRSDLRLKLLGVYADIQDRESFDKQFREIEALDDETAYVEAKSIQNRFEEEESMPSIDDLESQLRSGGSGSTESGKEDSESVSYDSEYDLQSYDSSEESVDDSLSSESDFEDMDLDLPDADEDQPKGEESEVSDSARGAGEDRDDMIEFDLADLESEEDSASELEDADKAERSDDRSGDGDSDDLDEPFDFSLEEGDLPEDDKSDSVEDDDLSLDFETSDLEADDKTDSTADAEKADTRPTTDEADDLDVDADGALDESFLDDLDAELDKVAGEDEASEKDDESGLDDLELDVSDEDLALMEEFSENDEEGPADAPESAEDDELSLDDELGLEDTLKGEEPADPEQEVEGAEKADEMLSEGGSADSSDKDESGSDSVAPPIASKPAPAGDSDSDIDEADLGDDDDFDFLAGTDEAATKLDLARAYVEMGDVDGARDILEEVALEGNDEQKAEAQDLLKNLS